MTKSPTPEVPLEAHEVHDLAARGLAALGFRSLAIRLMSLAANVLLARMLTPRDFGLMAFGLTIVSLGNFITDGGLGAALLRGGTRPTDRQLQALFGVQLLVATVAAAIVAAIAIPIGGTAGLVAAIMVAALPIDCVRVPAALLLERQLNYTAIVRAEIAQMLAYNLAAVGLVALGFGVWGLAIAVIVRAVVGTVVLAIISRILMRPRIDFATVRPLYKFGLKMQGIGFVSIGRDQGVNFVTTAIAGSSALGILAFGARLTQPIWLLFEGSWRISYPAMARLRDAGVDLVATTKRSLAIATATTGVGVVAVASCVPAVVPSLFGSQWNDAIPVVPLLLGNLLLGGPLLVCTTGFFATIGQPGIVIRGELVGTAVIFLVGVPLMLAGEGALGLAIAMLLAALAGVAYTAFKLRPHKLRIVGLLTKFTAMVVLAGTIGWLVAEGLGPTLWSSLVSATVGTAIYLLLLRVFERNVVVDCVRLIKRMLPPRFSKLRWISGRTRVRQG